MNCKHCCQGNATKAGHIRGHQRYKEGAARHFTDTPPHGKLRICQGLCRLYAYIVQCQFWHDRTNVGSEQCCSAKVGSKCGHQARSHQS